jgi:hypothetical protein
LLPRLFSLLIDELSLRLRDRVAGDRFDIGVRQLLSLSGPGAQPDPHTQEALLLPRLHHMIHTPDPICALLLRAGEFVIP